jgi:hypothetical protein
VTNLAFLFSTIRIHIHQPIMVELQSVITYTYMRKYSYNGLALITIYVRLADHCNGHIKMMW